MNFYLQRFGFFPQLLTVSPQKDMQLIVVIPSYNEPDLFGTLNSLKNNQPSHFPVEVITVINYPENSADGIVLKSNRDYTEGLKFSELNNSEKVKFHFIKLALPVRDAGVGLARKAGMDEAVRRFEASGNKRGVIVCLDADCSVSENYLSEIERHFLSNPESPAASIRFEHQYQNLPDKEKEAIVKYELFLRYYVQGLRYAGHPFAFHTVGSSMAVRSDAYQKQGGMNKRKAGEDFYFLQKIFLLGNFTEVNSCFVYPSSRTSDRVPFGTGRAVGDYFNGKEIMFYDPRVFTGLKTLFEFVKVNGREVVDKELIEVPVIKKFLEQMDFRNKIMEINRNSRSDEQFVKRFFAWFDGFLCLKAVHFITENHYPRLKPEDVRHDALIPEIVNSNLTDILEQYRLKDSISSIHKNY